jgi:hypothetical protein
VTRFRLPGGTGGRWPVFGRLSRHETLTQTPDLESVPPSLGQVILRPRDQSEVNHRNVLADAIGVGIASGIGTFLSVFLVRLGASNFLIGLLTAMPAFTGMLLAMPIGEFLSTRRDIVPWFSRSRLFTLSCYALTGLIPFILHEHLPEAIILIWAVATLPQTIVQVTFTVVMGKVAGQGGRFTLMSRRWSILGLSTAVTVLVAGQLLVAFPFPHNYQLVFIASAIGGLISYGFSSSIRLPVEDKPVVRHSFFAMLREHGTTLRSNRQFVNFVIASFVLRWGIAMLAPLLPIYWVHNAQASDASISIVNGTNTAAMMVAYFLWARASRTRSPRWVLLVATLGNAFYPLLTGLTLSVPLLALWAGMGGFFWAGVDLVLFDIILSTCPPQQQTAYIGMYQTTLNLALFLGPLFGSLMADRVGVVPALAATTAIRLAGFAMMLVLGVASRQKPASDRVPGGAASA